MQLNTSNVSLNQARKLSDSNKTANQLPPSTIPIQSPHSPLHICMPLQKVHNRLSARYINNNLTATTTNTCNNIKSNTVSNSKLLCSCEKKQNVTESTPPSSADSVKINPNTKRIITTRNASTSPNLDMRKIIYSNGLNCKQTHEKTLNKICLEKTNSLTETKPQKLLRTTRSLSPRPPVRHQKAIIISDEQVQDLLPSPNHYMKVIGNCHSEQTSPNTPDISGILFHYNEKMTNKSAECLPKVSTDPWLHINEVNRRNLSSESLCGKSDNDPWIKRVEIKPQFRQTKSFSGIRSDLEISGRNKRPPLTRNKSPTFQDFRVPMQSAPSSPNFLSVNNSFSLGFPLGGSLSSSPVKTKQYSIANNFLDNNSTSCTKYKIDNNCMHLNINQPAPLVQARHSCSSLTPNCSESELSLNMRRLSQQMRQEEEAEAAAAKARLKASMSSLSTSEQNVKQPLKVSSIQLNKGGADFSEYLQQHLQSGRKTSALARDKVLMQAKLEILAKNTQDETTFF